MKNNVENPFERIKTLFGFGKPKTVVNKGNPYKQARKDTATFSAYENAELKLAPITFQQQWADVEKIIVFVRNLYPPISVGLSLVVGYFLADIFAQGLPKTMYWVVLVALMLLIFLLASIVESLKMVSAKDLFKQKFAAQTQQDKPKTNAFLKVAIFTAISIAISAVGGGELSKKINDQSSSIDSTFNGQIDSIKNLYKPQIALYDSQIVYYTQNFDYSAYKKKATKNWIKTKNDSAVFALQAQKRVLEKSLDQEIKSLQSENKTSLQTDALQGDYYWLISAGVVTVFELFFILSFWFEYWYAYGCKEENRNFDILPPTFYEQFYFQSPIILSSSNPQNFATQKPVGFDMNKKRNLYAQLSPNGFCHSCGSNLQNKRVDALFCSVKCKNDLHNAL